MKFDINDEKIAYALLRVMLGMNLMMHGVSRIKLGPGEFAGKLVIQFANTGLPHWLLVSFGVLLPGVETLLGFLLVIGLRTRAALVGAATLMIAADVWIEPDSGLVGGSDTVDVCGDYFGAVVSAAIQWMVGGYVDGAGLIPAFDDERDAVFGTQGEGWVESDLRCCTGNWFEMPVASDRGER